MGRVLSEKEDYHVVAVKSTVVPRTENVIIPYSEKLDNYVDNRIVMKVKKMRSKIVKKHWKH